MIKKISLYCKTLKRKLELAISIPADYKTSQIKYDALFMLDGENIFKDSEASFGRSLRMGKFLASMANKFDKRICCIGIYNAGSEMGRINEYTPFKIEGVSSDEWKKQDTNVCRAFTKDLVDVVIPYIKEEFNISDTSFIMGSSLGALYVCYLTNSYPGLFKGCGLFSCASFLCANALTKHLEKNRDKDLRNFIYVGLNEKSDEIFDSKIYYNEAKRLYDIFKDNDIKVRLSVDASGIHNEATWEKHIMEFLSFMYSDDIIYSI